MDDVDDAVHILGPGQWLRSEWCAAVATEPSPSPSVGDRDKSLPVADAAAARTAVRQLWKPLGSSKGLNAAQQHWMRKLASGDLGGPTPPAFVYVPLRGQELSAKDLRDTETYKDRCVSAVGLEPGKEDRARYPHLSKDADFNLLR